MQLRVYGPWFTVQDLRVACCFKLPNSDCINIQIILPKALLALSAAVFSMPLSICRVTYYLLLCLTGARALEWDVLVLSSAFNASISDVASNLSKPQNPKKS